MLFGFVSEGFELIGADAEEVEDDVVGTSIDVGGEDIE